MGERSEQRRARRGLGAAAGLALALALGCGAEETPRPSASTAPAPERSAGPGAEGAPTIERVQLEPDPAIPGRPVRAVVDAADPDGDPVRLEYAWRVNGRLRQEGRKAALEGDLEKGDRVEVSVLATDGRSESAAASAWARVRNRAPVLHAVYLNVEEEVEADGRILAGPQASDPDEDELEFEYTWLVNGEPVEGVEGRSFSAEGLRRGDRVQVRVVAFDGEDRSAPVTSGVVDVGNSPPRIAGIPEPSEAEGTYRYAFEASDPDGDRRLRYRLAEAPAGMTIDPVQGVALWTPELSQVGEHTVEVVVEDPNGAASSIRFEVTVDTAGDETAGGAEAPPAAMPSEEG